MGQKVHPIGFRLGVYRGWLAQWFARRSYASLLAEDLKIRRYLARALDNAEISQVDIQKTGENIRVVLHSARPGVAIGKKGQGIESLRAALSKLVGGKAVEVSVQEVGSPELSAVLVARNIASQLERRANYKKVTKKAAMSTMRAGAKGIKVSCAGRLNGAEIARSEWVRLGSIPLHTFRSDVDYAHVEAKTTYGIIGVKVWICRGEFKLSNERGA